MAGVHLDTAEPFDDIRLILMQHGVECVGLPPIDRWRAVLARARQGGGFLGMDPERYPLDFEHFARYRDALKSDIPSRYPMPGYLALTDFESFLERQGDRYPVRWTDQPAPAGDDWRAGVTAPQLRALEPAV